MILAWENRRHFVTPPMVSSEMTSDKCRRRNSILMMCHCPDLGSAFDWLKQYPDLGSVTSSVGNFCDHFSDVISQGNHWWRCEMLSVFSGWLVIQVIVFFPLRVLRVNAFLAAQKGDSGSLSEMKSLLEKLPSSNYQLLKYLCKFLVKVSMNEGTMYN